MINRDFYKTHRPFDKLRKKRTGSSFDAVDFHGRDIDLRSIAGVVEAGRRRDRKAGETNEDRIGEAAERLDAMARADASKEFYEGPKFNAERFALMKPGCVLVNVARGEIIDEGALLDALEGGRLRGVALDVYDGEFENPPQAALWSDPRVLITPHISGASDENRHRAVEVFCDNLAAYIADRPLANVIDWDRGY